MGKLFEHIAAFLIRRKAVYALLLVLLGIYIFFGIGRLKLSESIYSIFPKSESYSKYSDVLKDNSFNKQVVFSIENSESSSAALDSIAAIVQNRASGLLTEFRLSSATDEDAVFQHFVKNLPALVDSSYYAYIGKRIQPDTIRLSISRVRDRLLGGSGLFMQNYLANDPLGISWKYLKSVQPDTSSGVQVEDGNFVSADGTRLLFLARLNFETSDNAKNMRLYRVLERAEKDINRNFKSAKFEYFGAFRIAAENAGQVRRDTALTTSISVSLILLLLLFYYRSVLTPIVFVLPGIAGGLIGIASAGFFKGEISAISIGTSSVLLGIIINYSFHFFTHLRHSGDLLETVREIAQPMIIGSFTTVAAFAALTFTDSVILQNFGLIALFSLTGAALFTLCLLPPLLHLVRFRMKPPKNERKKFTIGLKATRILALAISGLTVFFLFNISGFRFDDNLNNLGYHSDALVKLEERYTGINPKQEKKLQIFVSGHSKDEALYRSRRLYNDISRLKEKDGVQEILSVSLFALSKEDTQTGFSRWNRYWQLNPEAWQETKAAIASNGLAESGFAGFETWISGKAKPIATDNLLQTTGLENMITKSGNSWTIVTTVVVNRSNLPDFKKDLSEINNAFILDISDLATQMLDSVQRDLNLLLIVSALIVFLSLLIVYGRIELALFAFFPMVFSWIWILGISALFGIEFNFVNIVIATFIFGLGDDFSIFITDGLLQKLATGKNSLGSYRSAIILAGITTIIGTGALIFAKHPAIHSIAALSVIGIGCVLITTLFVQPGVFNFFVLKRAVKKLHPITLIQLIRTILLYLYFFIGCMHLNALVILLFPLPVTKKRKRRIINYCVSKLAQSTIYLGFHVKKELLNKDLLDFSKPKIYVSNHGSFLDILVMVMLSPKMIIVVKEWVYRSPFFGFFIRFVGYLYVADGLENNLEIVRERLNEGYSVLIFPEGSRSTDGSIRRFHKGAFYLASELQVDIQPLLIMGAYEVIPKNDFIIRDGTIVIKPLPPISFDDERFPANYSARGKEIQQYMRAEFKKLYGEKAKTAFYRPQILSNYLFKGPVLEWYFRVKWRLERKNYEEYDRLIGKRKSIVDIGCGYGFLDYYLNLRDPEREIVGIDYDSNKAEIAEHGYLRKENLRFYAADVREYEIPQTDVVFLNDVLHYLQPEEQAQLLNAVAVRMNEQGILFIRDGITDLQKEYKATKLTELFSTRIFRFNKTVNELHFLRLADIERWAENHGFNCEVVRHSKQTSNVLFILRKQ